MKRPFTSTLTSPQSKERKTFEAELIPQVASATGVSMDRIEIIDVYESQELSRYVSNIKYCVHTLLLLLLLLFHVIIQNISPSACAAFPPAMSICIQNYAFVYMPNGGDKTIA